MIKAAFTEYLVSSRHGSKHPERTPFTDGGKGTEGKVQGFGRTKGVRAGSGYFLGGPAVKTLPLNEGDVGSIPGQEAKSPHASWPKKSEHKTEAIL